MCEVTPSTRSPLLTRSRNERWGSNALTNLLRGASCCSDCPKVTYRRFLQSVGVYECCTCAPLCMVSYLWRLEFSSAPHWKPQILHDLSLSCFFHPYFCVILFFHLIILLISSFGSVLYNSILSPYYLTQQLFSFLPTAPSHNIVSLCNFTKFIPSPYFQCFFEREYPCSVIELDALCLHQPFIFMWNKQKKEFVCSRLLTLCKIYNLQKLWITHIVPTSALFYHLFLQSYT